MTALTMPARPDEDGASLRPVPWRRMAGVTWRQHRFALVGVAVLLGMLAVWLWIVGTSMHHAYAAAIACHPAASPGCQDLVNTFNGTDNFLSNGVILQVLPAADRGVRRGAVAGQGAGDRHLPVRLDPGLRPVALDARQAGAARGRGDGRCVRFGALLSWYYQPYFGLGNQALGLSVTSRFNAGLFDLTPIAFPAWTLAAFAIGALAGMLIRRVVPAIAAALAVYAGLAFATGLYLREHYLTPLVITNNFKLPSSAWILSQWWTKGGMTLSQSTMNQVMDPVFSRNIPAVPSDQVHLYKASALLNSEQYLTQHGYTFWTRYQPGSRFWPFQWIEGGWLLALSVLLIAATIWLVRRRAA